MPGRLGYHTATRQFLGTVAVNVAIVAVGQLILNVLNGPTLQHALVFVLLLSVIVTFYDRYRPIHVARFGTAENPPGLDRGPAARPRLGGVHVRAWRPATRCRRSILPCSWTWPCGCCCRPSSARSIGYEREIHDHPAGMRTHLLVSLGSAAFTVISIYGFTNTGIANEAPTDPSRVAAQIVTGIGFLGAGAIIKYGTSVRGLTTAASLWVTAAVGMAVGAGWWLVAIVTTAIVVFSLWPLNRVMRRIRSIGDHQVRVRIATASLDSLGDLRRAVDGRRIEVSEINSQRQAHGRQEIELLLNVPTSVDQAGLLDLIQAVPGVEVLEMDSGGE